MTSDASTATSEKHDIAVLAESLDEPGFGRRGGKRREEALRFPPGPPSVSGRMRKSVMALEFLRSERDGMEMPLASGCIRADPFSGRGVEEEEVFRDDANGNDLSDSDRGVGGHGDA